jgi:hypothetical protein
VFCGRGTPEMYETHPGIDCCEERMQNHALIQPGCSQCSQGGYKASLYLPWHRCFCKDDEMAIGRCHEFWGSGCIVDVRGKKTRFHFSVS